MSRPILEVVNLSVIYESTGLKVIEDVSFSADEGSFISIVGPSGCGKSTLLRCIAGLQSPSGGKIIAMGSPVNGPVDDMTMVFQEYNRSLLPWRNVIGNVMLAIEERLPKQETLERSKRLIQLVGLEGFERYYPWQLSGGMQQRIAIARALAPRPKILLMDEPFASVDALTRNSLEDQLLRLWKELGVTVVFVTHDIDESVYLSRKVIVLSTRPTHVLEEVHIGIEYPRNQLTTRGSSNFISRRTKILKRIGDHD